MDRWKERGRRGGRDRSFTRGTSESVRLAVVRHLFLSFQRRGSVATVMVSRPSRARVPENARSRVQNGTARHLFGSAPFKVVAVQPNPPTLPRRR